MTTAKSKKVRFYQAAYLVGGRLSYPRTVDWDTVMAGLRTAPMRTIRDEHRWFSPSPDKLAFGIHKILNTDFLTQVNESKATVGDLLQSADAEDKLAISSAVILFESSPYLAICLGDMHSPRATQIEGLLEVELPLADGAHWKIKPIMDKSRMRRFRKAQGVESFSSSFTTQRDLASEGDPDSVGPADILETFADNVDADFDVELKLELSEYARQRSAPRAAFKERILGNIRALTGKGSHAEAVIVDPDGRRELIKLVEDELTSQIDFDVSESQPRFSELLATLDAHRPELRKAVDSALRK